MNIGDRIKAKRIELGWSQRDLAEKMGYDNHSTITRIESGNVDIPLSKILKFSEALGVSLAYLMGIDNASDSSQTAVHESVSTQNEILDIIIRLYKDDMFFNVVKLISSFDHEKLDAISRLFSVNEEQ